MKSFCFLVSKRQAFINDTRNTDILFKYVYFYEHVITNNSDLRCMNSTVTGTLNRATVCLSARREDFR